MAGKKRSSGLAPKDPPREYLEALRQAAESPGNSTKLRRAKILAQLLTVDYERHQAAVRATELSENDLVDAQGNTLKDWFEQRAGVSSEKCANCGISDLGEETCPSCGKPTGNRKSDKSIRFSPESQNEWNRLPYESAKGAWALFVLGLLMIAGAAVSYTLL